MKPKKMFLLNLKSLILKIYIKTNLLYILHNKIIKNKQKCNLNNQTPTLKNIILKMIEKSIYIINQNLNQIINIKVVIIIMDKAINIDKIIINTNIWKTKNLKQE